jgi:hypothetical protein
MCFAETPPQASFNVWLIMRPARCLGRGALFVEQQRAEMLTHATPFARPYGLLSADLPFDMLQICISYQQRCFDVCGEACLLGQTMLEFVRDP